MTSDGKAGTATIEEATDRLIDYRGKTPKKSDDGVRLITAKVVKGGQILEEPAEYVASEQYREWMRRGLPEKLDVLLTTEAPLGEIAQLRETGRVALAQRIILLRAKAGEVDPRFLYYALQSDFAQGELRARSSGTTVLGIKQSELRKVRIPMFPWKVQERIVGVLSPYDDLIDNCRRRIRLLEKVVRTLQREWLAAGDLAGRGIRLTTASQSANVPRGWKVQELGLLAEEVRRNIPSGKLDEPVRYVGLEHIPRRHLALDAWETVSELGSNKLAFEKGDILFGKIRPYFHKVSIAPFDGVCSADTIVIRPRSREVYALVVACVFSDEFVARASSTANGAKMPRANWSVLADYPVLVPTGPTSEDVAEILADAIAQQQVLVLQMHNLRKTRAKLLPRLFACEGRIALTE